MAMPFPPKRLIASPRMTLPEEMMLRPLLPVMFVPLISIRIVAVVLAGAGHPQAAG
jgi:hypothetical protein